MKKLCSFLLCRDSIAKPLVFELFFEGFPVTHGRREAGSKIFEKKRAPTNNTATRQKRKKKGNTRMEKKGEAEQVEKKGGDKQHEEKKTILTPCPPPWPYP